MLEERVAFVFGLEALLVSAVSPAAAALYGADLRFSLADSVALSPLPRLRVPTPEDGVVDFLTFATSDSMVILERTKPFTFSGD